MSSLGKRIFNLAVAIDQLAYVLLPDSVPVSLARAFLFATFAIAIMTALYGNAWYLDAVHKRWERLRHEPDQAAALVKAKEAGGVGLAAVELAKRLGAHVIATTGTPDKVERLKAASDADASPAISVRESARAKDAASAARRPATRSTGTPVSAATAATKLGTLPAADCPS